MAVVCVLSRICTANLALLPTSDSLRESPSAWQQTTWALLGDFRADPTTSKSLMHMEPIRSLKLAWQLFVSWFK